MRQRRHEACWAAEMEIGTRIGRWTVIGKSGSPHFRTIAQCDCGTQGYRSRSAMEKFPNCQKCRIYHRADLIGQVFGRLTVLARREMTASGSLWECKCVCGDIVLRHTSRLKNVAESGCKKCETERRSAAHTVHGDCRGESMGGRTKLHCVWKGMTRRCTNPNDVGWRYYGGKGIEVCQEWKTYSVFKEWALSHGYAHGLTIDRLNSSKGYHPENCEWVTASENSRRAASGKRAKALYIRAAAIGMELH